MHNVTVYCVLSTPPVHPHQKYHRIYLFFSVCASVLTTCSSVCTCVHLLYVCVWKRMEKDTKRVEYGGREADPPPLYFLGSPRT